MGTASGIPLDSNRLSKIEVRASDTPATPPSTWTKLTNPLVLTTNGLARLTNTIPSGQFRRSYIAVETPYPASHGDAARLEIPCVADAAPLRGPLN